MLWYISSFPETDYRKILFISFNLDTIKDVYAVNVFLFSVILSWSWWSSGREHKRQADCDIKSAKDFKCIEYQHGAQIISDAEGLL